MFPWWVLLAFAITAGLVVALNLRFIRNLWQKNKDNPDDTWDPFG